MPWCILLLFHSFLAYLKCFTLSLHRNWWEDPFAWNSVKEMSTNQKPQKKTFLKANLKNRRSTRIQNQFHHLVENSEPRFCLRFQLSLWDLLVGVICTFYTCFCSLLCSIITLSVIWNFSIKSLWTLLFCLRKILLLVLHKVVHRNCLMIFCCFKVT